MLVQLTYFADQHDSTVCGSSSRLSSRPARFVYECILAPSMFNRDMSIILALFHDPVVTASQPSFVLNLPQNLFVVIINMQASYHILKLILALSIFLVPVKMLLPIEEFQ